MRWTDPASPWMDAFEVDVVGVENVATRAVQAPKVKRGYEPRKIGRLTALAIMDAYIHSDETVSAIARRFGVSFSTVQKIAHDKTKKAA